MKFRILLGAIATSLILHATTLLAAKPESDVDKFNYALGFQIGTGFKRDNLEINTEVLAQAIADVLEGKEPQLSMTEMNSAMASMRKKMDAQRAQKGQKAKADSEAFLAANKGKKGIKALASGVQYKIIKTGAGKQPKATDSITAHYQGSLINGTIFDSSYKRGAPATFPLNRVIKGWTEILQLMHEGDKWQVFIPSDLGYGASGSGQSIGPNEALIFDIELIAVK